MEWGPLDKNGHPIERKKGREYRRFINAMKKLGFVFDSRVLVAADYGAPTTRKRWYAVFRSDGKPIRWPEPTHCKNGETDLLGTRLPWVPVSTCLDFTDLGASIFERKKPLADATLKRIANGIRKFVVENDHPYFLPEQQALPFLIQYHSETTESVRGQKVTEPLKTIDTSNRYALISVFVTKFYKTGTGQEVTEPLHTITTSPGHFGLVSVFLIKYYGTEQSGHSVNEPLATITTKDRFGMVSTILLKNGERYAIADIYMRMLQPEELKLAQGFPKDYVIDHDIDGNPYPIKEQVAKIGNSVVPIMAMKIAKANI